MSSPWEHLSPEQISLAFQILNKEELQALPKQLENLSQKDWLLLSKLLIHLELEKKVSTVH